MGSTSEDPVRVHMGHLLMESLKKHPDAICQIDASTGEEETNASVLFRSIRLARCLRKIGLKPGEVLSVGGRNHLDLHIPLYAALLNGLPICGVDPSYKSDEIKSLFNLSKPKIAFCEKETYEIYTEVIKDLGLDTKVITFGNEENSMERFVEAHDTDEPTQDYIPAEFDLDKVYGFVISTSGTSGKIKLAAIKHEVMIAKHNIYGKITSASNDNVTQITLNLSPINWISGIYNAIGLPLMNRTKLQTSDPDNFEHILNMINKYKPVSTLMSPTLVCWLIRRKDDVDLTCFRVVIIAGAKIYPETKAEIRTLLHKDAVLIDAYGMTESLGPCLLPDVRGNSCGRRFPGYQDKLVDPESGIEITEPNTPGEYLVKGLMFSEYYNDPEETAKAHTEDGFYKSGDLLYKDENDNHYYVDRLKSLIKFRNYHILPAELEEVIRTHPAVRDVCVCGVTHPQDGQRPVACIVTRDGCSVTAQEIKDLVANKLSRNKQLSGGVIFLNELPMTSTGKIAKLKLLDIISKSKIE